MGRGIFRPLPYRPPRRIFLPPAEPAPPVVPAPGLKIRINRALLADLIRRQVVRIRAPKPLPLIFRPPPVPSATPFPAQLRNLVRPRVKEPRPRQVVPGVTPPVPGGQGTAIYRLVKERHRRIMFERMARRPLPTAPLVPPVVGPMFFPARPAAARPVSRPAARPPTLVPGAAFAPAPPPTRPRIRPTPRAPAVRAPRIVPGVPVVPPVVSPTPKPIRPPARALRPTQPLKRAPLVPGFVPPTPSSTPPPIRIPLQPPPRAPAARARALVPGVPPPPPVPSFTHVRRTATPLRFTPFRFRKAPVPLTAVPAPFQIVCTAADQIKASVNMEFEE
jgi:hypothetical protein